MTKGEFIDTISKETGLSKAQVKKVVDAFINNITELLKKGDKLTFPGFGTFMVAKRASRMGKNPRTQETIKIPEATVAKFKPGKALKEAVK